MARIMIVDDSAYARRVHRAILEGAGHLVIEAATGTTAIEMFSLDRPDVVLLDLSMEDISGLDVLRTLRQIDPGVQVVVVSADVQKSTAEAVFAEGASRFLPKPANAADLTSTVSSLVGDHA
ncbi:MAG TPA: response regulator [Gemmatimonadaceae bacterium]|jgi:two-component system chemotaxis response regulator CheY